MVTAQGKASKLKKTSDHNRARKAQNQAVEFFGRQRFQAQSCDMLEESNTSILMMMQNSQ